MHTLAWLRVHSQLNKNMARVQAIQYKKKEKTTQAAKNSMPVKRQMNWRTDRLKQNNISVHAAKHLHAGKKTHKLEDRQAQANQRLCTCSKTSPCP
jgi:uncharacterized protein involved in exopolysaccharide biosynthesis